MKRKIKILLCNEASFLSTGYGVYGKEILKRLHDSGEYEVAEIGCYATIEDFAKHKIPWKFYPNAVAANDKRYKDYTQNAMNQFGYWRFDACLADFKPDIVFDVRDYWMYSYQEISVFRKFFRWAIMPTVDSYPQKTEWLYTFAGADIVVPYTRWAQQTLTEQCGNKINMHNAIANAGINAKEFYPLETNVKNELRYKFFGNHNSRIIGSVMRNQKRKLLADCMEAFRVYLEKLKQNNEKDLLDNSYLYLHTTYPEDPGWDIPSLLLEYGVSDKVYFTYACRLCKEIFPAKFQGPIGFCPHCFNHSASFPSPSNGVSTTQLNSIYNLFDIYIQYAICEGFGMPQVEAAACGIPIASVDYSAMTEIVEELNGVKIPVQRYFREMESNADRAYPDIEATAQIMYNMLHYSKDFMAKYSEETRDKCIKKYTWDQTYAVWDSCFKNIISTKNTIPWDAQKREVNYTTQHVPKNLKKKDFIQYICDNILLEPDMINTGFMQSLIRDFHHILVAKGPTVSTREHKQILQILETYMNNKMAYENLRVQGFGSNKEDFLVCQ